VTGIAAGRAAGREDASALLAQALAGVPAGAPVWLVGDTSQMWEGWLDRVPAVQLATADPAARAGLLTAADRLGVALLMESPADVIPLPPGAETRHRRATPPAGLPASLPMWHFDPYSVAFRCLARGDEPDYRTALRYLRHGWMTVEEMDRLLADVLPRFTLATIAQDAAEFRRKYRGLCQMWRAEKRRDNGKTG
jgi:hypothetical protein